MNLDISMPWFSRRIKHGMTPEYSNSICGMKYGYFIASNHTPSVLKVFPIDKRDYRPGTYSSQKT